MPSALWTLLWLNFRGALRRIGRQMRSVKGAVFFIIGIIVLALWLGPSIFLNTAMPAINPAATMATAPVVILCLAALNLFTSAGGRAVTFTPAEIDFLFPGPFSRRQLLIFKLIKTGLATLFSALIFSIVLGRFGGAYFCRLIGVWLLIQFFQLLAMVIALLQNNIGERLIALGRRWILVALGVAASLAAIEVFRNHPHFSPALLVQARDTWTGRVVLAPFKIFAHALLSRRFLFTGLGWAVAAAAIDLALVAVVIGLDANYLETSATVSASRYDRLARLRRSGLGGLAKASSSKRKIPMLPWLAGTGPIIWRQMSIALRTARTLLIVLTLLAVAAGVAISRDSDQGASVGFIVGISVYLNVFLSQMLKFDFRGDLDHMDVLRSLPLRASAVAAAQLVTPALVLSALQLVLLATVGIAGSFPLLYLLALAAFAVPFNFLVLGIDNLTFLLFPFRQKTAVAGDMTLVGRQTILFICRVIVILIVAAIAGGIGAGAWWLTGHSWTAAAMAAWLPLGGAIALIVWLTATVYDRFDPSVSTPT